MISTVSLRATLMLCLSPMTSEAVLWILALVRCKPFISQEMSERRLSISCKTRKQDLKWIGVANRTTLDLTTYHPHERDSRLNYYSRAAFFMLGERSKQLLSIETSSTHCRKWLKLKPKKQSWHGSSMIWHMTKRRTSINSNVGKLLTRDSSLPC